MIYSEVEISTNYSLLVQCLKPSTKYNYEEILKLALIDSKDNPGRANQIIQRIVKYKYNQSILHLGHKPPLPDSLRPYLYEANINVQIYMRRRFRVEHMHGHKGLLIFDFDYTLYQPFRESLYPQIPELLKYYSSQGYCLAVASFNECADQFLRELGIRHYFCVVSGGFSEGGKEWNIRSVYRELGYIPKFVAFFDDIWENIIDAMNKMKIIARIVDPKTGVTKEIIESTFDAIN